MQRGVDMPHDSQIVNRFARKKEETRKRIIETAMNLIKSQGFESTTLDQIAQEADVARKTLYNYFPNKEDIVIDYMQREIVRLGPELIRSLEELPNTSSRIVQATLSSLEWFEKELNIDKLDEFCIYHMLKVLKDQGSRSGYDSVLSYILRMGQATGEIRQDISAQELADNLEWIHVSILIGWANNRGIDAKAIYERKVGIFLDGARNRN